jgi:16S rRNA (cytosine1402-N4)-methyltransferase
MEFKHLPVLLSECIDGLNINPNGVYLDGTTGGGGHSLQIASRLERGRLICIDKDEEALSAAKARLKDFADKAEFVHADFKNFESVLNGLNLEAIDGILLDLGVSSYQLDNAERGFSYMQNAPLDMRMDRTQPLTAFKVVNEYSEADLTKILYEYGEEKLSRRIAERICEKRKQKPIETTSELAKLVESCYPAATRWKFGHPAKRAFQAVRIEVNGELKALYETVTQMAMRLKAGGRLVIITFHSLEDRAVQNAFKDLENPCTCPPEFPMCVCGKRSEVRILTNKPITATTKEQAENPRSESAKLRVAERI